MTNNRYAFIKISDAVQSDRQYFLDWLRILAILVIFFHHCAKFFDYHTFTIYNSLRSLTFSIFREFNFLWVMPLFFIISGAAVYFSLNSRKANLFIKNRILRILIPQVLIGTFLINPPQIYLERLFKGQTVCDFIHWYPQFFDGIYLITDGNFAPLGMGTHLWYLMYLFFFSLIMLPLLIRKNKKSVISNFSRFFEKPWALFILFIPISVTAATSEILGLGFTRYAGGWDPMSFLVFFALGYLIFSNAQIRENIKKYYLISLLAAVIFTIFYLVSHFGIKLIIPGVTRHIIDQNGVLLPFNSSVWMFVEAFRGLIAWHWIIGLLGLGQRFLNYTNRFVVYANEAVLPFYILHHTVIQIIGFPIIQQNSNIFTKFSIIAIASFIIIMVIYELLVRRLNILRFLLGMKLKKIRPSLNTIVGNKLF